MFIKPKFENGYVEMKVGIDIGSRFVKIARKGEDDELQLVKYDSGEFYRKYGSNSESGEFIINMELLGIGKPAEIIATGYGRERAKLAGAKEIPEIQAHIDGVVYLTDLNNFTIIDFGGQDTKIARVENKRLINFITSDRCAASTGRFIENMAQILGLSLEQMARYYENPEPISATCAVFAETEILEKISRGISTERIAAGVNYSVVNRFSSLIERFPLDTLVATGGVALSEAVIKLLENKLETEVIVPPHPQFAGAIGCLNY
ncbi:2-hydroxyglutaryl-CoA dehydratase [bacterium]|nr:MAG: 2-hydroxyglutaryl-CoA dehydratase [bacterium]